MSCPSRGCGRRVLSVLVLALAMLAIARGSALAQPPPSATTQCTTTCSPTGGYYASDDDRLKNAAQLDRLLVDLRACLGGVGAATINPAMLIRFNSDGSLASTKVDVSGYEDLQCVQETLRRSRLQLGTKAETSMRCENKCGGKVSPTAGSGAAGGGVGGGASAITSAPAVGAPTSTTSSSIAQTDPTAAAPTPASAPAAVRSSSESRRPPPRVGDVDRDSGDDERPKDDPFRSVTLTANPLSLILLRFGLNIEYLPARHHAITLNPFGQFISVGEENQLGGKSKYSNFGGELGYRFYTGNRGANGFFIGPFATVISSNSTASYSDLRSTRREVSTDFFAYGGGIDLGGQHVFKFGLVIGAGAGVMYLTQSAQTNSATSSTVKFEGVLPRFLFTLGYAF